MSSASSNCSNSPPAERISQADFLRKVHDKIIGGVSDSKRKPCDGVDDPASGDESVARETTYYEMGRVFGRIADPYAFVSHIIRIGVRNDTADGSDDEHWLKDFFEDLENCQMRDTWKIWCNRFIEFRQDVLRAHDSPNGTTLVKKVAKRIASGINAVRGDDTAGLKGRILKYLPEDVSVPLTPPIAAEGNKTDRGWNHPLTAQLLMPLEWEASEYMFNEVREGRKKITANHWPRYFYPSDRQYNLDDIETGLFHGYLMLRVAKHIFQGPSAALERPGYHRGKRSNAQIIGITSMTPYTIAYVAVQIRYALSSQTTWSTIDAHFDYRTFFWNIIQCFDNGEGSDIIALYNYHVFGPRGTSGGGGTEDEPAISDLERMKIERARKRARIGGANA